MAIDKILVIDCILSHFFLLLYRKDGVPIGYKGCTFHRYEIWNIGLYNNHFFKKTSFQDVQYTSNKITTNSELWLSFLIFFSGDV